MLKHIDLWMFIAAGEVRVMPTTKYEEFMKPYKEQASVEARRVHEAAGDRSA